MVESGRTMFMHSVVIGLVAFALFMYGLGNSAPRAENRAFTVGAAALLYMQLFGHQFPPTSLNQF